MSADELENQLRRVFARAAADIEDPQQAGQRLLQCDYRPRGAPRHLAAAAVAAVVLIAGASYGVSAALTGHAPRSASTGPQAAALTSVNGCPKLKQADGTLEQVNGTSLVIKTASGHLVIKTATGHLVTAMFRAPLSDVTNGTRVTVIGSRSGETIAARNVLFGWPISGLESGKPPGPVAAYGTVTGAGAAGFTLVTGSGTRIPVTTSSRTDVEIPPRAGTVSQLRTGIFTVAVVQAGPHRTLSATAVMQPPPVRDAKLAVGGCSHSSVEAGITNAWAIERGTFAADTEQP
jgi:hypothetical protein